MRKLVLGALTAFLLGTAALVPQAEARCWWNGFAWHCWYPHGYWWRRHAWWGYPHYYHPYAWYWRHHYPHYVYRY